MRRLEIVDEVASALALLRSVALDDLTLSPRWLVESRSFVVAQESGRHLEPWQLERFAGAFVAAGAHNLTAIVNDSLAESAEAYEVAATAADLGMISDELIGLSFVLVDATATNCILFTAYDLKLIAGTLDFVEAVAGEPHAARRAFLDFARDQRGSLRDTALRAANYMRWLDPS